jgi:serine/threonine protein kinase
MPEMGQMLRKMIKLGQGGMAEVWRRQDIRQGRNVAIRKVKEQPR